MDIAVRKDQLPARPLKVLVPLIQIEIEAGDKAGIEHYRTAGEMLIEAKEQVAHGEWKEWVKKNFNRSLRQAQQYMQFATTVKNAPRRVFESVREATRPGASTQASWHEPVRESINRVNVERLTQERQGREKEDKIIEEIAKRIIDIGYRALAAKFHPDRGGSAEGMARLTKARDLLKGGL